MKRTRILAAALLFLVLLLIGIACTQSRTFSYQPYTGELEGSKHLPNNFQQEAAIWLGVNNGSSIFGRGAAVRRVKRNTTAGCAH